MMMMMMMIIAAATTSIIITIIMLSVRCLVVHFSLSMAIQKSLMGILGSFLLLVGSL
jgi:hypothetical protein